jgi:GNAT superfamily N-acetyltransferase
MPATDITLWIARFDKFRKIDAACCEWGYKGGIAPGDTAWLAEIADELIGVERIAPEFDNLVLRGVQIAELWQHRGIGTRMLYEVAGWHRRRAQMLLRSVCPPRSILWTSWVCRNCVRRHSGFPRLASCRIQTPFI